MLVSAPSSAMKVLVTRALALHTRLNMPRRLIDLNIPDSAGLLFLPVLALAAVRLDNKYNRAV